MTENISRCKSSYQLDLTKRGKQKEATMPYTNDLKTTYTSINSMYHKGVGNPICFPSSVLNMNL